MQRLVSNVVAYMHSIFVLCMVQVREVGKMRRNISDFLFSEQN